MKSGSLPRGVDSLSFRETEVLRLAALGLTNAETASRLGITTYGIKFHLAAIYRKLGVANRTEAAVTHLKEAFQGD
jgi:DNA-binding NarL/FixJ family response regulator